MFSGMPGRHLQPSLAITLGLIIVLAGCGRGDDRSRDADRDAVEDSERAPTLREGLAGARDAARGLRDIYEGAQEGDGRIAETVDFRQLRELLPERAAGLERTDASGERQSLGGFSISRAEADYREDDQSIKVQIMDGAGTGAFALIGAAWLMAEFDRESNDGYERTTTFEGHRAYEKLDERRNRAELQFVVERRFLVSLDGRNVSMDDLHRAARSVDLRALAAMRDVGRES